MSGALTPALIQLLSIMNPCSLQVLSFCLCVVWLVALFNKWLKVYQWMWLYFLFHSMSCIWSNIAKHCFFRAMHVEHKRRSNTTRGMTNRPFYKVNYSSRRKSFLLHLCLHGCSILPPGSQDGHTSEKQHNGWIVYFILWHYTMFLQSMILQRFLKIPFFL